MGMSSPLCRVSVHRVCDVRQVENRHVEQGEVTVLGPCLSIVHPDEAGVDPPVRVRQQA